MKKNCKDNKNSKNLIKTCYKYYKKNLKIYKSKIK